MSKETNSPQNSAIEQRINEMVQQSRILEAYMNDIVTKEATIVRLIEEARLAASALHNIVPGKSDRIFGPCWGWSIYESVDSTYR